MGAPFLPLGVICVTYRILLTKEYRYAACWTFSRFTSLRQYYS